MITHSRLSTWAWLGLLATSFPCFTSGLANSSPLIKFVGPTNGASFMAVRQAIVVHVASEILNPDNIKMRLNGVSPNM